MKATLKVVAHALLVGRRGAMMVVSPLTQDGQAPADAIFPIKSAGEATAKAAADDGFPFARAKQAAAKAAAGDGFPFVRAKQAAAKAATDAGLPFGRAKQAAAEAEEDRTRYTSSNSSKLFPWHHAQAVDAPNNSGNTMLFQVAHWSGGEERLGRAIANYLWGSPLLEVQDVVTPAKEAEAREREAGFNAKQKVGDTASYEDKLKLLRDELEENKHRPHRAIHFGDKIAEMTTAYGWVYIKSIVEKLLPAAKTEGDPPVTEDDLPTLVHGFCIATVSRPEIEAELESMFDEAQGKCLDGMWTRGYWDFIFGTTPPKWRPQKWAWERPASWP